MFSQLIKINLICVVWLVHSVVYAQTNYENQNYHEFQIKHEGIEVRLYRDIRYYSGEFQIEKFEMSGSVSTNGNFRDQFLINHYQGIEVYNFSIGEWTKVKVIPGDMFLKDQSRTIVGHVPGLEFNGRKSEIYLGFGAGFAIQEFNQNPYSPHALFRLRVKLKH